MKLPVRIWAAAVLLVLLLGGLVIRETRARAAGVEVRLPMEAVDPRALLTGQYVSLQLTQALEPGKPCPPGAVGANSPGWIALTPSPSGDRVSGFAPTRAQAARLGPVTLKGKLFCWSSRAGEDRPGGVTLDIGVRRFHADQRQAQALDKALQERRTGEASAFAVVSVGGDGTPRLKGVIVNGRRTDLSWR